MNSSKYPLRKPGLLLLTMASILVPVASPRSAEASSLWEWLFPSRNHSYYAGPHGPAPQATGQPGHVPPAHATPVSNHQGYSQTTAYAGNQAAPGASPLGAPQQLTNPLVIIPASSAPIAGQQGTIPATNPSPAAASPTTSGYPNAGYPSSGYPNAGYPNAGYQNSSYPNTAYPNTAYSNSGGMASGGMANGTSGYAGQAASGYVSSSPTPSQATVSGYAPSGVISTSYASTGSVMNGQVATTTMMPSQTQQVFMANQAGQWGNCATCLPGHRRTASYRTVWYRVPTTNVRPVAAVDPCTGLQSTVMRPCTTYSWQARRVPTMRSPSLCERLFSCFRRPQPPPIPMTANYLCGPNCGPAPAAAAPYYAPPATTTPSGISPWGGTSLPAEGYPSGSYPGGTFQGNGATGGSPPQREPADERPSLDTRRYTPGNGDAYDPQGNSGGTHGNQGVYGNGYENWDLNRGTTPGFNNNRGEQDGNRDGIRDDNQASDRDSAARHNPNFGRTPTLRGPQYSGPSEASSVRTSEEPAEPRGRDPQPVPDPDILQQGPQRFEPPRLLNPKDRRASQAVHRAGDYVLASWPESTRKDPQPSSQGPITPPRNRSDVTPETPPVSTRPSLDDGGWRSVPR